MTNAEWIAVLKPFGLQIGRIKSYRSLYRSRAAFRVTTDDGHMAVKPFRPRSPGGSSHAVEQMKRVISCIRLLTKNGYPHMPKWRRTASGRYWVRSHRKPFYMTEWVSGRPIGMTKEDFGSLGRALAKLHSVRKRSQERGYTVHSIRRLNDRALLFRRRSALLRRRITPVGKWLDVHGGFAVELSAQARKALVTPEIRSVLREEPRHAGLIHGDVTIPNLVFAPDGIKLIDWDTVRAGSTYEEIAKTLANTAGFQTELMGAMLQGYEAVRPMRSAERRLIAALFRYPREVWTAAGNEVRGLRNGIFHIASRTWEDRLNAVRWLDRWADSPSP